MRRLGTPRSGKQGPRLRGTAGGLALALGVQALLALGLTVPQALAFRGAPIVRLSTAPADPRDLLRGHYLTLNYAFSTAEAREEVKEGQIVYLPLTEQEGGLWEGGTLQTERPADGVYLRGRVEYSYGSSARVNYGIERFYLEESAAQAEDERRWRPGQAPLVARVQVGRGGEARVVGVER